MKREILFRGKTSDGKWVEGYGMAYYKALDIAVIIHEQGINIMQHTVVNPETICQFTGKTQSLNHPVFADHIKIFEDDVFTIGNSNTKYRVVLKNYEWVGISDEGDEWGLYEIRLSAIRDKINLIGNVFDNPELLEK